MLRRTKAATHRAQAVVIRRSTPGSNGLRSVLIYDQGIHHHTHGNEGVQGRTDFADLVSEIEQPYGQTAEDDGKV